jgi:hypothetical protein
VADVGRSHLWKAGTAMSLAEQPNQVLARLGKAPVRVKLERINCDIAKSLPPDGNHQVWLDRLRAALGTASMDFVDATLFQIQAAARLPNSGLSEIAVNAALAMIEGEKPRGETECAIVIQMACIHSATMAVLGRLNAAYGNRNVLAAATAASRLSRAFSTLVETLRRLRNGGSQVIRIERVDVRDGGQAVIGNIKSQRSDPHE